MEGALTRLRLQGRRAAALRRIRDLPDDAPLVEVGTLAVQAGFAEAIPLLESGSRRDAAESALAALSRERELDSRTVLQGVLGLMFVAGLFYTDAPITRICGALAMLVALPVWTIIAGGPGAVVDAVVAMPLFGRPASDMLHARALSVFALFLGTGADPALARRIAEGHTGRPLSDAAIERALGASGAFGTRRVLGEASEAPLLRGALRMAGASQLRLRFLLLGIATVALVGLFVPAFLQTARLRSAPEAPRDATWQDPAGK